MNENHFVGNVGKIYPFRTTRSGDSELTFSFGIDTGGRRDDQGRWISEPTIWKTVVVYRSLADNLRQTFLAHEKSGIGMRLVVVGRLRDDSFTPRGQDKPVMRDKIVASSAGPDLTWAIADVTKAGKTTAEVGMENNLQRLADDDPGEEDSIPAAAAAAVG